MPNISFEIINILDITFTLFYSVNNKLTHFVRISFEPHHNRQPRPDRGRWRKTFCSVCQLH
ncbi:hypothetical protein HMPREF0201_01983 [Cedecea davisae DSM 4568]|uniref:Uncharacterized protein n=1 Tax=Cedecea davisae DSM 4568 TaxID=566551 RepID=S3IYS8_9ENTR|nr:hypothetical protein HMPREF0201_01983 [Cedecea davisae DSM 4568]